MINLSPLVYVKPVKHNTLLKKYWVSADFGNTFSLKFESLPGIPSPI